MKKYPKKEYFNNSMDFYFWKLGLTLKQLTKTKSGGIK